MRRTDQQFQCGDLVRIAENIPWIMGFNTLGPEIVAYRHDSGKRAVVYGSYADQFGGNNHHSYTLHIEGTGRVSWFEEGDLSLIEECRMDLFEQWRHAQ